MSNCYNGYMVTTSYFKFLINIYKKKIMATNIIAIKILALNTDPGIGDNSTSGSLERIKIHGYKTIENKDKLFP